MSEFQPWREYRDELVREADKRRLVRELRTAQHKKPYYRGHIQAVLGALRGKTSSLFARHTG